MLDFDRLDPSALGLYSPNVQHKPSTHFVEFYDEDRSLISSVGTFVATGINHGEAAIVIADAAHLTGLEAELSESFDLQRARDQGLYTSADAAATLSLFMEDGLPDPVRFGDTVGALLRRAAAKGKNVRVFGEMVALLWAQGNGAGALLLEDLWNRLLETRPFRLFCAYPTSSFEGNDVTRLNAVCSRHSHIVVSGHRGV